MNDLHTQVAELLQQEPTLLPAAMAERLGASELEIVRALPNEMAVIVEGGLAQSILESLVDFGPVTTIVHAFGSIFEVKAPFPKGKAARGYYNLMGKSGELHGHLKLDNVAAIALVSKPFMGRESHYFGFFSTSGENIFKIYLGRDEKRELFPEQVSRFNKMKIELAQ